MLQFLLTNSTLINFLDLDEKLGAMMTILEAGNSSNQGYINCKWREDLKQMLEELGQSYCVLALSYNQLKSKTCHGTFPSGSLSSSTTSKAKCSSCNRRATSNLEDKKPKMGSNSHLKSLAGYSDLKFDGINLDFELLKKQKDELLSSGPCIMKFKSGLEFSDTLIEDRMTDFSPKENILMKMEDLELNHIIEDPSVINSKFDRLKHQMTKLTEDNMHQLVELVQRNDEKRETIRRLQLEVETLKHENKVLQISLRHSNADSECSQSQISRPGRISVRKLFRGCSP